MPACLVRRVMGKFLATADQLGSAKKPTDVSPLVKELVKSTSVTATRPILPDLARSFISFQPGSMFFSLPSACSASATICSIMLCVGPGQQIAPFSLGENRSSTDVI